MRSGEGRTCTTWRAAGISGRRKRDKAELQASKVPTTSGNWPRYVRSRCTKTADEPWTSRSQSPEYASRLAPSCGQAFRSGSATTIPGGPTRPWPGARQTRHTGQEEHKRQTGQRQRSWRPDNNQNQAYPGRKAVRTDGTTSDRWVRLPARPPGSGCLGERLPTPRRHRPGTPGHPMAATRRPAPGPAPGQGCMVARKAVVRRVRQPGVADAGHERPRLKPNRSQQQV